MPEQASHYLTLMDASSTVVGIVPATTTWTQRLLGTDTLDTVTIPWEYLLSDGSTESRYDQVQQGWYCLWRGHRYILEDPSDDSETEVQFTARSAETELANYYTNYSPGPATYLNMLPTDMYAALLSGRVGRPVKNAGFGILDNTNLPTNWSHPSGWASVLAESTTGTFGYTGAGSSSATLANYIAGTVFSLSEPGLVSGITARIAGSSSASEARAAIYRMDGAGDTPGTLVALSPAVAVAANQPEGDVTFALSPSVPLLAGDYLLALHLGGNGIAMRRDDTGAVSYSAAYTYTSGTPSPAPTMAAGTRKYCIYAAYTVGGLRRVWQADAGSDESVSDELPCTPGVTYRAKVDILATGTGTRGVKFRWKAADGTTTDSAVTTLGTADGTFHAVETPDVAAEGTSLRIVLVTSGTSAVTQFDDVRLYEIGPDTGWTADASAMDTRDGWVPPNDGAIQRYGVWTEVGTPITALEASYAGDYLGRVFNGPHVTIHFGAGGSGARAKVRINGLVREASLDVSAATTYSVTGLDPANDHIVEVEVVSGKVVFLGLTVTTANPISMRWDWKTVYEAVVSIREAVGGELEFDTINRVIRHKAQVGRDLTASNIVDFRRASNIIKMTRTEGRSKLVNRLTGLGYGEGQYQLAVTVDATGTDDSGRTSIDIYGVQRGTYVDKECKSLATMMATLQRMVEQSCWYRNSYTVQVLDETAALCKPGDTGHFVYRSMNLKLRILEITRANDSAEATLKVANIEEDLASKLEATRKELATISRSYQGVPTDISDSFSEQFERTTGGTDVPAEVHFFVPYAADLIDLRLRYQIGGMRSFATAVAGGGQLTTLSGGGSTSGSGGGQTSSSVTTPSGGGSTSGPSSKSTADSVTPVSTAQDVGVHSSASRNNTLQNTYASVVAGSMNSINYPTRWAYGTVFNRKSTGCNFDFEWRAGGPSGTLVYSGTAYVEANSATTLAQDWSSYNYSVCLRVRPTTASPDIDTHAVLVGYAPHGHGSHSHGMAHTHTVPDHTHPAHAHSVTNHTHTTPDHSHTIPDHNHGLNFGIRESNMPATLRVYLDGALITELNDRAYVSNVDLMPYIAKDTNGRVAEGWHTVSFRTATNGATGSVRGSIAGQKFLSTEAA